MARLLVDNKEIEAREGANLLQTCLDNDIYVPNLCHMKGRGEAHASCRLCFVEIEGVDGPAAACTVRVRDDMNVRTDAPAVRQLQRAGLRMLLSVHHIECKTCPANRSCELQRLAKFLKAPLNARPLETHLKKTRIDQSHPHMDHHPNRCVLCGRCIYACKQHSGDSVLSFARRGMDTVVTSYGAAGASTTDCPECVACIEVCPVGALTPKNAEA